jgi:hypothetical protein
MKSEIHEEHEFYDKNKDKDKKDKNECQVYCVPNLKDIIENYKSIDNNDPYSIDKANWSFTYNQLQCVKNFPEKEAEEFIKNNLNSEDIIHPKVLQQLIEEKVNDLIDNGEDISNKLVTARISLDNDFNRVINIDVNENANFSNCMVESVNVELPPFNDLIKEQIKLLCNTMLCGYLDDEELEEFIEERIEDYKESPYTTDWLEGYIEGFLDNDGYIDGIIEGFNND